MPKLDVIDKIYLEPCATLKKPMTGGRGSFFGDFSHPNLTKPQHTHTALFQISNKLTN